MKKIYKFAILLGILAVATLAVALVLPAGTKRAATSTLLDQSTNHSINLVREQLTAVRTELENVAASLKENPEICNSDSYTPALKNKVDAIFTVSSANKIVCSTNPKFVGYDALLLDSYKNFLADPDHKPALSRILTAPDNNKGLAAYVPIFDSQNNFHGSIASVTYLSSLGTKISHPNSLAKAGYLVLFDDNGDVLYHFDKTLVGKNHFSPEIQTYLSNNSELNAAFKKAAEGIITYKKVSYVVRGQNRIGEFRPVPVGNNHYLVVLTSLPDY